MIYIQHNVSHSYEVRGEHNVPGHFIFMLLPENHLFSLWFLILHFYLIMSLQQSGIRINGTVVIENPLNILIFGVLFSRS
jgi:hypothetical protein